MSNKIEKFVIQLADNKIAYYVGDVVKGSLVLDVRETVQVKRFEIRFKGFAQVAWLCEDSVENNKEKYFSKYLNLLQPGGNTEISEGSKRYPFKFQIPLEIPPSTEIVHHNGNCHVRYIIKGDLLHSGGRSVTKLELYVRDKVDLGLDPLAMVPFEGSDTTTFCCCSRGHVEAKFSTDKRGFVPGQFIALKGNITNATKTDLRNSNFSLVQRVKFRGKRKQVYSIESTACEAVGPSCRKSSEVTFNNISLPVPTLPSSGLKHCKIIDVEYFCRFWVEMPNFHNDLNVCAPILIGSVSTTQESGEGQQEIPTTATVFVNCLTTTKLESPTYHNLAFRNNPYEDI